MNESRCRWVLWVTVAWFMALPAPAGAGAGTGSSAEGVRLLNGQGGRTSATVEVFSNSAIYLTNAGDARVYLLDGLERVDTELSAGLPTNERDAQAMVRQRIQAIGAHSLADRTKSAAEGIVRAALYGIDRIPAVVVNGESVIYGVTDIDVARAIFQRSLQK